MPTAAEARKRLRGMKGKHVAVAIWMEDDVLFRAQERRINISRKQASDIIDEIDRRHNCELGISWTTIDCFLDEIKGK